MMRDVAMMFILIISHMVKETSMRTSALTAILTVTYQWWSRLRLRNSKTKPKRESPKRKVRRGHGGRSRRRRWGRIILFLPLGAYVQGASVVGCTSGWVCSRRERTHIPKCIQWWCIWGTVGRGTCFLFLLDHSVDINSDKQNINRKRTIISVACTQEYSKVTIFTECEWT